MHRLLELSHTLHRSSKLTLRRAELLPQNSSLNQLTAKGLKDERLGDFHVTIVLRVEAMSSLKPRGYGWVAIT